MNTNNYVVWIVYYWNHDPRINDCVGNALTWRGKARTKEEAGRKAEKENDTHWFRLRKVEQV